MRSVSYVCLCNNHHVPSFTLQKRTPYFIFMVSLKKTRKHKCYDYKKSKCLEDVYILNHHMIICNNHSSKGLIRFLGSCILNVEICAFFHTKKDPSICFTKNHTSIDCKTLIKWPSHNPKDKVHFIVHSVLWITNYPNFKPKKTPKK